MVTAHVSSSGPGPSGHAGAGVKRKAAVEGSPVQGRVTRRSAANALAGDGVAGPSTVPIHAGAEDEQDHGGLGARRSKRVRRSPPRTHLPEVSDNANNPIASSSSLVLDPTLINASASSTSPTQPPIPRALPYPIGLTPYRFECFLPHVPPPPPGDPKAPGFKPFDPHEEGGFDPKGARTKSISQPPPHIPPRNSPAGPSKAKSNASAGPTRTALDANAQQQSLPPPQVQPTAPDPLEEHFQFPAEFNADELNLDGAVDFLSDPAYASIAALLSASQSQMPGGSGGAQTAPEAGS